jgi:hypothetical protein
MTDFMDRLDRTMGHWTLSANAQRWEDHVDDLTQISDDAAALTITRQTKNWKRLLQLENLVELTLENPDQRQLDTLSNLPWLRRLRISRTRTKSLEVLECLPSLEELVVEHASGLSSVEDIGKIANLRSLHLQNLKNVTHFSGLTPLKQLRYLGFSGTLDHRQRISGFDFFAGLKSLEFLRIVSSKVAETQHIKSQFTNLVGLKKVYFASDLFELDFFAWFQASFPHVDGSKQAPFDRYGGKRKKVSTSDFINSLPVDQVRQQYPGIEIDADGTYWRTEKDGATLLGKGMRPAQGSAAAVDARCAAHARIYNGLVTSYSDK